MKKEILLLRYNKPTIESFEKLANIGLRVKWADLQHFGARLDVLNYQDASNLLEGLSPFDVIMVGDIFWPTGQNICKWAEENKKPCYFLQHGQWKYIDNKKNPRYLPAATFVYGKYVRRMMMTWPYAKKSQILATGNPRYDGINRTTEGEYVYFAPPVMHEQVPSGPAKTDKKAYSILHGFSKAGLSKTTKLLLHPHYREGNIKQLKRFFPEAELIDPKASALELVQKSRMVLTHRDSTTVLDAIACGKPSVLMNFHGFNSFFSRGHFGKFATETVSYEDCVAKIKVDRELDYSDYVDRAKEYLVLGEAGVRIKEAIEGSNVS